MRRSGFSIFNPQSRTDGAVAQLGEHLLCKQGVVGSIPISSTKSSRITKANYHYVIARQAVDANSDLRSALVFATTEFVDN